MINILLVDDREFTQQALYRGLESDDNLIIVAAVDSGKKALEIMQRQAIDIAIVDLEMPEMDGFELTRKICQHHQETKVIIFSSHDDSDSINTAVNCGAKGYLLKGTAILEIIDTIYYVNRGYFQLGSGLFERLIRELIDRELETSESLSKLQLKSQQKIAQFKTKIDLDRQQLRQEVSQEIHCEIDRFKQEIKQGLHDFQDRVSLQLNRGIEDLTSNYQDRQHVSQVCDRKYFEMTNNIIAIENKHRSYLAKISKEILIWRYCIIFLLIALLAETTSFLIN